jgi:hypothetical protein
VAIPGWCKKIQVPVPLDDLLVFSRKMMLKHKFVDNGLRYEGYPDRTTRFWDFNLSDIKNEAVDQVIDYIQENYQLPLRYPKSYVSILEFGENDVLPPHKDDVDNQIASIIIGLIGGFKIRLNDDNTQEILDEITYYPKEAIVLNNSAYTHSGVTTKGYKLSFLISIDSNFDIDQWFKDY